MLRLVHGAMAVARRDLKPRYGREGVWGKLPGEARS